MLKLINLINIRNYSRTSCLLLRNQTQYDKHTQDQFISEEIQKEQIKHAVNVKENENVKITKLRKDDKDLFRLITFLRSKKKAERDERIIVEGNQLIKEAIVAGIKLDKLIFSDSKKINEIKDLLGSELKSRVEFLKVPLPDLTFYSVLTTCPGLIGIFEKPQSIKAKPNAFDINIICDNVREPQNLGAMVRIANALPINLMLLPKGSVDPWETKAIRGSSGSIFHLPVQQSNWNEMENNDFSDELVLIADNNISNYIQNKVLNYDQIPTKLIKDKRITLIIGGETHGISEEALNYALKRDYRVVNIPIDESVNSLNVSTALGIILFELRRKIFESWEIQ